MKTIPGRLQTTKRYLTFCLFGATLIWGVEAILGDYVNAWLAGTAMVLIGVLWTQAHMVEWVYSRPFKRHSPARTQARGARRSVNAACARWSLLVAVMGVETIASPMPFALLLWTFLLTSKKGPTESVQRPWKGWAIRMGQFVSCLLLGLPLVLVLLTNSPAPAVKLYEILPGVKASLPDLVMALPSVLFALTVDGFTRKWFPIQGQMEVER